MSNRLVLATTTGVLTLLAAGAGLVLAGTADPVASPVSTANGAVLAAPSSPIATTSAHPTSSTAVAPAASASDISPDEAASIALAHVGAGRVREIEREFEHGRHEWKVEIVDGPHEHDVRVDATTGAITRTDRDDNDGRERGRRDDRGSHGRDDRGADN
jgi:hypothetical protein